MVDVEVLLVDQVLSSLQQHQTRDQVELVVDLGIEWDTVKETIDSLVSEGLVSTRQLGGEEIYELAPTKSVASSRV